MAVEPASRNVISIGRTGAPYDQSIGRASAPSLGAWARPITLPTGVPGENTAGTAGVFPRPPDHVPRRATANRCSPCHGWPVAGVASSARPAQRYARTPSDGLATRPAQNAPRCPRIDAARSDVVWDWPKRRRAFSTTAPAGDHCGDRARAAARRGVAAARGRIPGDCDFLA